MAPTNFRYRTVFMQTSSNAYMLARKPILPVAVPALDRAGRLFSVPSSGIPYLSTPTVKVPLPSQSPVSGMSSALPYANDM